MSASSARSASMTLNPASRNSSAMNARVKTSSSTTRIRAVRAGAAVEGSFGWGTRTGQSNCYIETARGSGKFRLVGMARRLSLQRSHRGLTPVSAGTVRPAQKSPAPTRYWRSNVDPKRSFLGGGVLRLENWRTLLITSLIGPMPSDANRGKKQGDAVRRKHVHLGFTVLQHNS